MSHESQLQKITTHFICRDFLCLFVDLVCIRQTSRDTFFLRPKRTRGNPCYYRHSCLSAFVELGESDNSRKKWFVSTVQPFTEMAFQSEMVFICFLTPLLVAFVCGAAAFFIDGIKIAENWFSPSMPLGFMTWLLFYIGLGEEIGWRGFALPRCQELLGSLGGSIANGVLWALWHLPLFLMPGSSQYGHSILFFIYFLTCWSITMAVFVAKSHGSVIPAILFHVSVNFLAFAIFYPYKYFSLFWGITAVIAVQFLPKPLVKRGRGLPRSEYEC